MRYSLFQCTVDICSFFIENDLIFPRFSSTFSWNFFSCNVEVRIRAKRFIVGPMTEVIRYCMLVHARNKYKKVFSIPKNVFAFSSVLFQSVLPMCVFFFFFETK
jgi:hypothetical protein